MSLSIVLTTKPLIDPQDPWCDPDHPILLKFEDISAAAYRIKDGIINTPCDRSHMNSDLGLEMYFKKDYMQVVMARDTEGRTGVHVQWSPKYPWLSGHLLLLLQLCILCSSLGASRSAVLATL